MHETIVSNNLFQPGQRVAIAASGGKDSTVLAHLMKVLNERHSYGLDLFLLSIDEGITGYRDDSLETVKRNGEQYALPLMILSYKDLYGWSMDEIVAAIGKKSNCTFCGVFRRQALDRGAQRLGAHTIVTGHNADDIAETVLMNLLRGDIGRLGRCVDIKTGGDTDGETVSRSKPFKYSYEKVRTPRAPAKPASLPASEPASHARSSDPLCWGDPVCAPGNCFVCALQTPGLFQHGMQVLTERLSRLCARVPERSGKSSLVGDSGHYSLRRELCGCT